MLENVLSDKHCDALICGLERHKIEPGAVETGIVPQSQWASAHNLWEAGQPFIDLIDHPMTCSVLHEVVAPLLRLETAYSFIRENGSVALQMHGGRGHASGGGASFRYQVTGNKIYTGLTAVGFALQDISEDDGGFCCIP